MTQQEISDCLYALKSQIEALETRLNSMELFMKRLNKENYEKLVDVVNVKDLTEETHIEREMLLWITSLACHNTIMS